MRSGAGRETERGREGEEERVSGGVRESERESEGKKRGRERKRREGERENVLFRASNQSHQQLKLRISDIEGHAFLNESQDRVNPFEVRAHKVAKVSVNEDLRGDENERQEGGEGATQTSTSKRCRT